MSIKSSYKNILFIYAYSTYIPFFSQFYFVYEFFSESFTYQNKRMYPSKQQVLIGRKKIFENVAVREIFHFSAANSAPLM